MKSDLMQQKLCPHMIFTFLQQMLMCYIGTFLYQTRTDLHWLLCGQLCNFCLLSLWFDRFD